MTKTLMIALCVGTLAPVAAHADAVSDRVTLEPLGAGCPTGQSGFKRIKQNPDGSQTGEPGEFQVPAGKYLEITSVEYTTPYWTQNISSYVQHVTVNILKRGAAVGTNVFHFSYSNRPMFDQDEQYQFQTFGQFASPGADTRVASFPVGPLMGSQGRLCLAAPSSFHTFQGRVRVRGRLIPSGELEIGPGDVLISR